MGLTLASRQALVYSHQNLQRSQGQLELHQGHDNFNLNHLQDYYMVQNKRTLTILHTCHKKLFWVVTNINCKYWVGLVDNTIPTCH
jgi:hypothetical protein